MTNSNIEKPFIYIAALRRTGSTMLCEALTAIPHCLVFNEPNFAANGVIIRGRERILLGNIGIDSNSFVSRWSGWRRRFIMQGLKWDLAPKLENAVSQFGVKEIFHKDWRRYRRAFPELWRRPYCQRSKRHIYFTT